jgi:hypothetical protein
VFARPTSFRDTLPHEGALAHQLASSSSLAVALKGTVVELTVGLAERMGAAIDDVMGSVETVKEFSSEV